MRRFAHAHARRSAPSRAGRALRGVRHRADATNARLDANSPVDKKYAGLVLELPVAQV